MESQKRKKKHRSKVLHPNLNYKYTILSRHEFLDCKYYVNGVKNEHGEEVIRPLTEEEKTWLDNFYAGDLNASFNEKNEYIFKLSSEDEAKCNSLQNELTAIRKELNKYKGKKEIPDEVKDLYTKKKEIQEEYYRINKKADSFQRNNRRNHDLYGKLKIQGKLTSISELNNDLEDYED